jgi:site-specific DNA-methyltransferase (adenine-specific)
MSVALHYGDCREVIPTLGVTVDAVVTDPPYNLEAMAKRFAPGQKAAASPEHQRFAKGFMGMTWDSDVAFQPAPWVTIASVLRPGGFLVAFGGTRTYHRMACAIEDAGFVIQDCLMWLYATGFPKRRDMLKPAYEPIVLAYKPGGKRTLQVDECRIGTGENKGEWPLTSRRHDDKCFTLQPTITDKSLGRWPANICHDGSDEVVALFPASAAGQPRDDHGKGGFWGPSDGVPYGPQYGDSGSAARFFFSAKAGTQDRWGSRHPTVKPVELMKWLVALVTPPGGTVLDPFAGSGTTAVAAIATGRNAILIEDEASYIADIRERVVFYEGGGQHSTQAKHRNRKIDHGPLFAEATLTPAEDAADSFASYNAAITAIGERVQAGEPVPDFMLRKAPPRAAG